jgi:hypothetical protein
MPSVDVSIESEDLACRLASMRDWLAEEGIEPTTFRYDTEDCKTIVRVEFKSESEACVFAAKMEGVVSDEPHEKTPEFQF